MTEKHGYQQGLLQTPIYQSYEEQTSSTPQQKPWMPNQKRTLMTARTHKSSLPNHHQQPRGFQQQQPRGFQQQQPRGFRRQQQPRSYQQQQPHSHLLTKLLYPQQAQKHPILVPTLCTLIENIASWLKGPNCVLKEKPLLKGEVQRQPHLHPDLLAILQASPSWLQSLGSIPEEKAQSNVPSEHEESEKTIFMQQEQPQEQQQMQQPMQQQSMQMLQLQQQSMQQQQQQQQPQQQGPIYMAQQKPQWRYQRKGS